MAELNNLLLQKKESWSVPSLLLFLFIYIYFASVLGVGLISCTHLAEPMGFPYLPGPQPVWWTESAWRGQISTGCSTGSWAAVGCWPESLSSNTLVLSWEQGLLNLQLSWSQAWGFPSCCFTIVLLKAPYRLFGCILSLSLFHFLFIFHRMYLFL